MWLRLAWAYERKNNGSIDKFCLRLKRLKVGSIS